MSLLEPCAVPSPNMHSVIMLYIFVPDLAPVQTFFSLLKA